MDVETVTSLVSRRESPIFSNGIQIECFMCKERVKDLPEIFEKAQLIRLMQLLHGLRQESTVGMFKLSYFGCKP